MPLPASNDEFAQICKKICITVAIFRRQNAIIISEKIIFE